jgi:DNA-binding LacI/PurR family transcriptional regulator
MADVARVAGVSPATVSYVLAGRAASQRIPSATVERVQRACERLAYRRDYLATAMATKRTGVVGVLFANALGTFMDTLLRGIQTELRNHHRQIALCLSEDDAGIEADALRSLRFRHVDGVIAFPVSTREPMGGWDEYRSAGKPVVFVDSLPTGLASDAYVKIDDHKLGREAAALLCRAGHERFALVGWEPQTVSRTIRDRQAGFQEAVEAAGGRVDFVDASDGRATAGLLAGGMGRVGVFAARTGDLTGPMMEMLGRDRVIDPRLAFASCGVDGEPFFVRNHWWMAEQPVFEMGRSAARMLLAASDGEAPPSAPMVLDVQWRRNRRTDGQPEPA